MWALRDRSPCEIQPFSRHGTCFISLCSTLLLSNTTHAFEQGHLIDAIDHANSYMRHLSKCVPGMLKSLSEIRTEEIVDSQLVDSEADTMTEYRRTSASLCGNLRSTRVRRLLNYLCDTFINCRVNIAYSGLLFKDRRLAACIWFPIRGAVHFETRTSIVETS